MGYHYWDNEQTNLQDSNTSSYSNNSFSIFPYIKKIFPLGSKFALHIQGETNLSSNKHKAKNNNESYTSTSKSLFIGLRSGFNYKLSKKVLLQANFGNLGYSYTESENLNNNSISSKSNNFSLSLSSSNLTFGVAVLL